MKSKITLVSLVLTLIVSSLFISCTSDTSTSTTTSTAPQVTSTASGTTTQTAITSTVSTTQANWWDKFGEPQYGGKITLYQSAVSAPQPDVYSFLGGNFNFMYESLFFKSNWTLDREIWSFSGDFTPAKHYLGNLAESWDFQDPQTLLVNLRHDVHWQNRSPVNGRKFTSDDVIFHYDRMLGTGSGYTTPSPIFKGTTANWESVSVIDEYTVVFKFTSPGISNLEAVADNWSLNTFEAPETIGDGILSDWNKAIGTGPWMINEYIKLSSVKFVKNPDYWGYDERNPENQLPYADDLSVLIINDSSTRIAALRTGQLDVLPSIAWQQAETILKTNQELQTGKQAGGAQNLSFRVDKEPFTDIKVRKALQMAVDFDAIAESYFGGNAEMVPGGLVSRAYTGYYFTYEDWPQELKDEYSYNPVKAKTLLAEAGYPTGFNTNVVASTTDDLQLLQVLKAQFQDIGVNMEINTYDSTAFQSLVRDAKQDQLTTKAGSFDFPPARTIEQFYSKGADIGYSMVNDSVYDSIRNAFIAATTSEEVTKLMREADQRVIEQHWYIVTPEKQSFVMWQPYLKGYSGEKAGWGQGLMWARLWVDQATKATMGR